jgi:ubiquitin-conjugating enzyme E2 R
VETVLVSVLSLLDDAECSSPANVDAGVMLRDDLEQYQKVVRENVELSRTDIPEGFVMPTHESSMSKPEVEKEDPDFWADSGEDDDDVFGGSDSSDFGYQDDDDGEMELDDAADDLDDSDDDEDDKTKAEE